MSRSDPARSLDRQSPMGVVKDPLACRLIALNAYAAWQQTPTGNDAYRHPEPGDLVLEITTAFRWLANDRLAPGEALGWLLRIEEDEYGEVFVLRPIYEEEGEFRWSNCAVIRVHTEIPVGQGWLARRP